VPVRSADYSAIDRSDITAVFAAIIPTNISTQWRADRATIDEAF
jgi:hypothetical protein